MPIGNSSASSLISMPNLLSMVDILSVVVLEIGAASVVSISGIIVGVTLISGSIVVLITVSI